MTSTSIPGQRSLFRVERTGQALVISIERNAGEIEFMVVAQEGRRVLDLLERDSSIRLVLIDAEHAHYLGSSILGFFVALHARLRRRDGKLAFCNISSLVKETLHVAQLDQIGLIYLSRQSALSAMNKESEKQSENGNRPIEVN
jgi:anti-anti-sigma factor